MNISTLDLPRSRSSTIAITIFVTPSITVFWASQAAAVAFVLPSYLLSSSWPLARGKSERDEGRATVLTDDRPLW